VKRSRDSSIKRGFTLPEVLVAAFALGVVTTVAAQMLSTLALKQRDSERRLMALAEADNCLERLSATPWSELTNERAASCRLSESAVRQLPGAELKIDVQSSDEQPPAKAVTVAVHWRDTAGHAMAPVKLVAWVYRSDAGTRGE